MAYHITYAWKKEKTLDRHQHISAQLVLGFITFAAVLSVRMFFPQASLIMDELLHPLTDEHLAAAFGDLYHSLEQGIPAGEAVMTFCSEIIGNAA